MKKTLALLICVVFLLSTVAFAAGNTVQALIMDLKIKLNGQEAAVNSPVVINNTTYVPLRNMSKLAGQLVYYDNETKGIFVLEDGLYKALEVASNGWIEQIEVTVSSGDIVGVNYNEYKTKGKSENVNGYADRFPNVLKFPELSKQLVEKQDPSKVDAIAGASLATSHPQFVEMAKKAIEAAKAKDFADNTYTYVNPVDERGYYGMIQVTYKDKKIVDAKYDEYTTDINANTIAVKKSEDTAYIERFRTAKNLPNLDLAANYKAWGKDFEEADSIVGMKLTNTADAVAGATHSFDTFKVLARKALMSGRYYANGKYYAIQKEFEPNGWKYSVAFEVKNGKIANVKFDGVNKDGASKTDPNLDPKNGYAADGPYFKKFGKLITEQYKAMEDGLVAAQTPSGVDKVSGATHSWATFRELVTEALENGPVK